MNDNGAVTIGWLPKLVLTFAVLGFLSYDGISILVTSFNASDRAQTLASEAADDVHSLGVQAGYAQIEKEARSTGDNIAPKDFTVSSSGEVTLVLTHTSKSLWMYKFASLKKYLTVHETGEGEPAS